MKRTVALTILGLGVAATASTAFGQAAFSFSNYVAPAPYVPIVYDASVPGVGGTPVGSGEGVIIELWWAPGADQPEGSLVFGENVNLHPTYAGYTVPTQLFTIADFVSPGPSEYTVQFRASGTAGGQAVDPVSSRGPLANVPVAAQDVSPPEIPLLTKGDGFTVFVPEPSTFALAGLGAAALMIFRRRD